MTRYTLTFHRFAFPFTHNTQYTMQFYIKIQLYVRYNASQVLWVKCYLVGSTVFWTLFYYILGKVFRLLDRKIMDADVNGPWFFAQLLHKPLFLSLKKYIIPGQTKSMSFPQQASQPSANTDRVGDRLLTHFLCHSANHRLPCLELVGWHHTWCCDTPHLCVSMCTL